MNRAIATALCSIGIAQVLKIPFAKDKDEGIIKTIFSTGGMPSSHSAGVSSLATYVGLKKGFTSVDFALATIFGLIVMYDAQGIRRHAGEIAIQVNDLDEEVEKLAGDHPGVFHTRREKELKEMLGHQPEEVAGGAVLGVLLGAISASLSK
ncbi:haloperoxidase [Lottiidibacillus patelloidae]|uniref:Haloperoxidase n=1 Tax=Lottiidibacillus patelloidae TaxID=2670334 RepID=A0A263BV58_9BACI|nr:divergent PAP2 family protein [Lottiidibacillus patelloidae]OZM57448.1 haloperoxidase [Lottiidibacillus patelloidae]